MLRQWALPLCTKSTGAYNMAHIILVGLGGFLGSVFRFSLTLILVGSHPRPIPFPTLAINLVGSFLIGILLYLGESRLNQNWFYFLVPGLVGGFTTYSAFSGEVFLLLKNHSYTPAIIYIAGTVIGGLILTAIGYVASKACLNF
jgi:fluoride exporter